ncbi:MAG: thioredoxin-dependent thiol peroxidase, partial [Chloroflexi bacterium]|nr:thioredoxin-dependent thiol peroxidase [Chloroflexota bacterium]
LYFYPKDDTPGCTKEACGFRDSMKELRDAGVAVIGISADSISSHRKFSEKFGLRFPLLSDSSKAVANAYGAWGEKQFMGRKFIGMRRMTFLIDEKGKIVRIWEKVKPEGHAQEVLEAAR